MAKSKQVQLNDASVTEAKESKSVLDRIVRPSSKLASYLIRYMKSRRRVLLVGPPGCAKTSLILLGSQVCDMDLVITAAGTRERVDFSGAMFPDLEAGYAKELLLETMYKLVNATRPTAWYLDDLGNADIDVQAAIKAMITSGGPIANNPNIYVCGATNRPGDKTGVRAIHESLKSEFHLAFAMPTPDMEQANTGVTYFGDWREFLDGWVDWAMDYGAPPEIIAWHRNAGMRNTELGGSSLYDWKPNPDPAFRSADCRTWKSVIDMWNDGIRDLQSVGGALGKKQASEFLAFASLTKDLPSIDEIRMDPDGAPIPGVDGQGNIKDPSPLYLITAILAAAVEPEWLDEMAVYMERLPRIYQAMLMRDTYRKHGSVLSGTKRFVALFLKNKSLFNSTLD